MNSSIVEALFIDHDCLLSNYVPIVSFVQKVMNLLFFAFCHLQTSKISTGLALNRLGLRI